MLSQEKRNIPHRAIFSTQRRTGLAMLMVAGLTITAGNCALAQEGTFMAAASCAGTLWAAPPKKGQKAKPKPTQKTTSSVKTPPKASDNAPAPTIDSFSHDAQGWLHSGQTISATLTGTPGGHAAFRIPGLVKEVAMTEETPGQYGGSWKVPAGKLVQLTKAAVIGSLEVAKKSAPLIQAASTVSVDTSPPRIREQAPETDSKVTSPRPNISAVFEDQGSGVDRASLRLLLNGKDVTNDATVTAGFLSYKPTDALPAGKQTVQITGNDIAGNKISATWQFVEQPREQGGIKSIKDNADKPLEPGDTLHVEMTGTPGGTATFTVGNLKEIKMPEDTPGHYAVDYTIRKGDDVAGPKLSAKLVTPEGEKFVQQSEHEIKVVTGKPDAPKITFPGAKDKIDDPLVIKGTTTPNAKVHVKMSYKSKVFGLVGVKGTAVDTEVTADKAGKWETEPITLKTLLSNSGSTEYTITATASNAQDEQSAETTMTFKR